MVDSFRMRTDFSNVNFVFTPSGTENMCVKGKAVKEVVKRLPTEQQPFNLSCYYRKKKGSSYQQNKIYTDIVNKVTKVLN